MLVRQRGGRLSLQRSMNSSRQEKENEGHVWGTERAQLGYSMDSVICLER
jgi:hypothetical protein